MLASRVVLRASAVIILTIMVKAGWLGTAAICAVDMIWLVPSPWNTA